MKHIDIYRDKDMVLKLSELLHRKATGKYIFMEVCGGHTAAIHRFGIPCLLPPNIRLISGPGCPVCVTGTDFIDMAVEYSGMKDMIIATFGDMIRVPGNFSTLEREKASGADIRIVLSAREALEIARNNPGKKVVFLAIGFETTAPGTAVSLIEAREGNTDNFCVLSAHKLMPPAMECLIRGEVCIDGFICPGHVAVVTGSGIFDFIPEKSGIACVVSGFEPVDILLSLLMLVRQVNNNKPSVEIQYTRAVTREGNHVAREKVNEVFEKSDSDWRGLGIIRSGGLGLRDTYERFDAGKRIPLETSPVKEPAGCICGEILRGIKTPGDCKLFARSCHPGNPVGACMVSSEGSCNIMYKYKSPL